MFLVLVSTTHKCVFLSISWALLRVCVRLLCILSVSVIIGFYFLTVVCWFIGWGMIDKCVFNPQRGLVGRNGCCSARRWRERRCTFSKTGKNFKDTRFIYCDLIYHSNYFFVFSTFILKPSSTSRKPQPVFIDTVGLFSPNEVCSHGMFKTCCLFELFYFNSSLVNTFFVMCLIYSNCHPWKNDCKYWRNHQ